MGNSFPAIKWHVPAITQACVQRICLQANQGASQRPGARKRRAGFWRLLSSTAAIGKRAPGTWSAGTPGRVGLRDAVARAEHVSFVEGVVHLSAKATLDEKERSTQFPNTYTYQCVYRAITSHAQKHFIKLLLKGEDLPPAVAVTGHGFTLSGALSAKDACSWVL